MNINWSIRNDCYLDRGGVANNDDFRLRDRGHGFPTATLDIPCHLLITAPLGEVQMVKKGATS